MSSSVDNDLVLLGRVSATHGIKGDLRVALFSGDAATLLSTDSVILKQPGKKPEIFDLLSVKVHGKGVLLRLKAFHNINEVLHLVGSELFVLRSQLPELEQGEYYWLDLIGMQVIDSDGVGLGKITDIIATGSNDVFVVKTSGKELLIPAVEDIVTNIDTERRVVTVDLPEGLLDL